MSLFSNLSNPSNILPSTQGNAPTTSGLFSNVPKTSLFAGQTSIPTGAQTGLGLTSTSGGAQTGLGLSGSIAGGLTGSQTGSMLGQSNPQIFAPKTQVISGTSSISQGQQNQAQSTAQSQTAQSGGDIQGNLIKM